MQMSFEKFRTEETQAGAFDDDAIVRGIVTEVIRKSPKTREVVADEMSVLLGRTVTARMLNSFTAEANEKHRWPLSFTRAFCSVTGDWQLIRVLAERSGLRVITQDEAALLELGRQYLAQKTAAAKLLAIELNLKEKL